MVEQEELRGSPSGYLELLRENRNFRSMWIGQVISLFGDWFNLIGSAALITQLTASGLAVSGLFLVRMLAPFLISPFAGVAADRFNRKHLLILSDLSRTLIVLGFLLVRKPNQVWLLYALTAAQLAISGVFFPARNAILPDIVSPRELGSANALSSSTWAVMLSLGSAMGGLVVGGWGIYPAFVVDSLSFVCSAFFISQIAYRYIPKPKASGRQIVAALDQYLEGLRYLKDHRDTLATALHKAALSLTVNGAYQILQVVIAEEIFVIGAGGGISLGILYAVSGIGTGLGPILTRKLTGDEPSKLRIALLAAYGITTVGMLIQAPLIGFGLVLFGTFWRAFGGGINWTFSTQLLLVQAPEQVRGRVFSTEFAMMTLANAVSVGVAGWLLDRTAITLQGMMWLTAGLTLIPMVLWGAWIWGRQALEPSVREP